MDYYNEIDPYAAHWLRNLIDAGHLPYGVVDTRSIEDVCPDELRRYRRCHFFAGIGVWALALEQAGWPDDREVWTGSCPCQPFSTAGKGAGFADERHLWPAWFHLISQRRPAIVFGEQVASRDINAWIDLVQDDMEALGHAFAAVAFPAASVGAAHIRDRCYWVADDDEAGRREQWGLRLRGQQVHDADGRGANGGMADSSSSSTRLEGCDARSLGQQCAATERGGAAGIVGHADQGRGGRDTGAILGAQGGAQRGLRRVVDGTEPAGAVGVVANTDGGHTGAKRQQRSGEQRLLTSSGGPVNGFWSNAEWIACRDGKARPVEPGTFPLAHGVANRVGRLRAYGNAIVAPQARIFIESYLAARAR